MTITQTTLKRLDEEVVASADYVTGGVIYIATNKGNVYSYSVANATVTLVKNVNDDIKSMSIYGTTLYIGLAGGGLASLTTS